MSQRLNHVLIAMDGVPAGILEATERAYRFSYLNEYKDSAKSLPVSINYPLQEGPWDYAFAGELPPYFAQLLPEGWLRDVAESAHLPMNTPLEKLASLCRENLGAVEIYDCPNYSIFHRLENGVACFHLTPFYDILPIHLFARQDKDQLALTLNAKKRSITKTDFQSLAVKLGIKVQTIDDFVSEFEANLPAYLETFKMFGVEEELPEIHEKYIEEQLGLLR